MATGIPVSSSPGLPTSYVLQNPGVALPQRSNFTGVAGGIPTAVLHNSVLPNGLTASPNRLVSVSTPGRVPTLATPGMPVNAQNSPITVSSVSGIRTEVSAGSDTMAQAGGATSSSGGATGVTSSRSLSDSKVLDKRRLQELVKDVDPLEQMDDDVEEMLMQIADDFIDNVVTASCQIAKHRKANTVEVKDVQLHLERNWNMWIPGFGSDELKPFKKAATTEAHKQRLALIKKTMKKY
jgi:transcription initiation factor TFIID subunit 12